MKKRKLLPGFALAALMALGLAGTAHANTYTSCASFVAMSPPPTGDVVVNEPGACSLPSAINITTGSLTINAGGAITASSTVQAFTEVTLTAGSTLTANGTITTGNNRTIQLTAPGAITTAAIAGNGHVGITSTGSTVTINGVLQSALGGTAGNIWLQANGNIKTVAITTNAGGGAGGVQIDANKGGANVLFKIGASSANGINGVLTTHNGTFITNGTAASTGGITITNGNQIVTGSATADGGLLFFNAQKGTFELTAGTLKTDGVSGHHSGSLVIMADTVKTAGTAVISASQAAGTAAINHFVGLATKNLNITGTSLAIKSDGDGVAGFFATSSLVPPGALTVASNGNLISLSWTVTASNTFSTNVPVAVTGGALTMTANGNSAQVQVSGYPVTFSNTTIDLESKGKTNHSVQFDYFATGTGPDGLIFNNTGLVTIDASGTSGGTGGFVDLQQFGTTGGGIRINTPPTFTVNTNGPSSGGNAGPVNFNAGAATIGASTKVVITANGPSAGAGNGALITLHPGTANLKFGTNNGDIQLSSNGGSTTGDAGTLDVQTFPGSITIDTASAVSATVPGTDGKGGTVTLFANGAFSVTPGVSGGTINVDGKGTKDGGSITIFGTSGSVNLGTAAGGLSLSASGTTGTGNGGSVDIGSLSSLTVANDLSVSAGTGSSGNGHGGTLNFHGLGGFTVTGTPTVKADGHGTGIAGSITIGEFSFSTMTLDNATFSASGDTAGSGKGGQLTFTNLGAISQSTTTMKASAGTGSGGNSDGGSISIAGNQITFTGTITANGNGTGNGGTITLDSTTTPIDLSSLTATAIFAQGGNNSMTNGGSIIITNVSHLDPEQLQVVVNDEPDGDSFSDDIIALRKAAAIHSNTTPTITAMGSKLTTNATAPGQCKQYMVTGGTNPQPYTFWDCSNGGTNATLPATYVATTTAIPSTVLQSIFPSVSGQNAPESSTTLYVWVDPAAYNTAYGLTVIDALYAAPNEGGQTDPVTGTTTKYQVNIFEQSEINNTEVALTPFQIKENTAHELGHVWDNTNGNTFSATYNSSYSSYDQSDLTNDTGAGGADKGAATNTPCTTNNKAPFDGQTGLTGSVYNDVTNAQVCNESTGTATVTYSPVTSLALAQKVSPGVIGSGQREIFAQAFAWVVFVQPQLMPYVYNTPYQEATDGLFENGYYACAVAYAQSKITGGAFNPPTGHCGH